MGGGNLLILYTRCMPLENRWENKLQEVSLGEYQYTQLDIDQIFAIWLLIIIDKCNEHNRKLYIAFVSWILKPPSTASTAYLPATSSASMVFPPKLCHPTHMLYFDSESWIRYGNDLGLNGSQLHPVYSRVVWSLLTSSTVSLVIFCAKSRMLLDPHLALVLTTASNWHGLRRWHRAFVISK